MPDGKKRDAVHAPDENIPLLLHHYEMHTPVLVLAHEGVRHQMQEHVREQPAGLQPI